MYSCNVMYHNYDNYGMAARIVLVGRSNRIFHSLPPVPSTAGTWPKYLGTRSKRYLLAVLANLIHLLRTVPVHVPEVVLLGL